MALIPLSLLALIGTSFGLSIPFERRSISTRSTTVSVNTNYNGNLGFSDDADVIYTVTVYVQGQPFQVQIDSGSSDFWLDTSGVQLEGLVDTGVTGTVCYADTTCAAGNIVEGDVSFGEFTVNGQALINAPGSNATRPGFDVGLLGVGPPFSSIVYQRLTNTTYSGLPFLVNVFSKDPSEPNFMAFLLSRSDVGITEGGVMSIGELVSNYTAILDQPKLPVVSDGFWEAFMDGVYINGQFYNGHSSGAFDSMEHPGPNQTSAILDTGTSLAAASKYYLDAMYENIPGAVYNDSIRTYTLPCDTKLNISMVFNSNAYPMDPIDLTTVQVNPDGSFFCFGTFFLTPDDVDIDFVLGDAFLRNVYSLFSYGSNFTGLGDEPPFMQILSVTDPDQAWVDFDYVNARRIVQAGLEEYNEIHSITASSEVAPATTTFSLVAPSSGWQTAASSTKTYAHTPSAGGYSSAATSAVATQTSVDKNKLGADLAANVEASASSSSGSNDWSALLRNTYIIIGLLGGAILLLLGVLIKLAVGSPNNKYRPVAFGPPYEPEKHEAFSTPYDDIARPAGSH